MKHAIKSGTKKSARRPSSGPSQDKLIAQLESKYGKDLVEPCLKEGGSQAILACVEKAVEASRPRLAKNMKRERGKG